MEGPLGLGHKYFPLENLATPSQLGRRKTLRASDSQTATGSFRPETPWRVLVSNPNNSVP